MKWLLAFALVMGVSPLLHAQSLPASVPATETTTAAAAFKLEINAPDEVRLVLERHLELLRYRELSDLNDSELLRLMAAAQQDAQDLVATLGYFAPTIHIELINATGAAARVVKLSVAPGEPTLVSEVHINFSGPIVNDPLPRSQRQQIQSSWPLHPGTRFTQAGWDGAKQQALRLLTTQRFPTGKLSTSLADIDPVTHRASLSVTLDSGPAYQLGALVITGTQRFDTEVVTRLARLTPGDDYEQTQLVEAQQRLSDSGFFDSVFVSLDTTGDPTAAPVRLQLREAKMQKMALGLGASTDSGARLSVEHTHNKLPLIGWRAVTKLSLDRETRALGTELTAPPNDSNWRWVTSALLQNQQINSTDVSSQRLRAGRSQSGEKIDRNYYLQYDRAETAATDAATVPVVAESLSANYAVTRRNFDSLPFPSRGWGAGMEIGGGTTLGSQQDPYSRILVRGLRYQPLGDRTDGAPSDLRAGRIAWRAELGAVIARDGISLPSTQLFLTGGDTSVRGYGLRDIGVTLANGLTAPGRYLATGSMEWQRPITTNGKLTDWESTVFIDAGAVADKPAELHAKVGVGIGARWKSPVGPLQIDLAYGVAVESFRLHMNVGFTF